MKLEDLGVVGKRSPAVALFEFEQLYAYSARLLLFACSCASSDSASLPLRYGLCAAAHKVYYAQKVDLCSGCSKSPVVNGSAWPDSA
jgi:hypothetical protein